MANPIEAIKRASFRPFKKRFDRIIKELAATREDIAKLNEAIELLNRLLAEDCAQIGVISDEIETLKTHITCIDDSMKSIEIIVAAECTPEMIEAGVE